MTFGSKMYATVGCGKKFIYKSFIADIAVDESYLLLIKSFKVLKIAGIS